MAKGGDHLDMEAIIARATSVSPLAPGGTMADYVADLHRHGQSGLLSSDPGAGWTPDRRFALFRFPIEHTKPPDPEEVREALRQGGAWVVSYTLAPGPDRPPNCMDYVCRDRKYDIDRLAPPVRRNIRRGLRSFTVRLCTWDELAEKGYPARADTAIRHGYAKPPEDDTRGFVDRYRGSPHFDIWGAWDGDELMAWIGVIKIDNWAYVHQAQSRSAALPLRPNNAVLYLATRHIMVVEKRDWVTYGVSSIQRRDPHLGLHNYKTRMGYVTEPLHRAFAVRRALRLLLKPAPAAWAWERLAKLLPWSHAVARIAGMAGLLSGRELAPLDWAEEAQNDAEDD